MLDEDKVQRQVHFIQAQIFDNEDTTGANNSWNYNRAPDGYKFRLMTASISVAQEGNRYKGVIAMFDGHEYTHWNIWPGVESRELLFRKDCSLYLLNHLEDLHSWECKEYTLAVRSVQDDTTFKACIIVWYYLQKMSWLEKLYYAVIQPKGDRYKKTLGVTMEPRESGII